MSKKPVHPLPKTMARIIGPIIGPIVKKHSSIMPEIIMDWGKIVGPELSDHSIPVNLIFRKDTKKEGVLVIHTSPSFSLKLQIGAIQIMERINQYFGYKAVIKLRILQTPLKRSS